MKLNLKQLFTKKKFITFSIQKQHKVCTQLLRDFFDTQKIELFNSYNELREWMDLPKIDTMTHAEISDLYHDHLIQAKIKLKEHNLLTRNRDKKSPHFKPLPITIFLDNIRSAHNVGSILRTVEGLGLGNVIFSEKTPYIDNLQVQKTSMGTFNKVPCKVTKTLSNLPQPIIALETCENAISIHDIIFPKTFTLVVGNEEYGCSEEILKSADYIIEIPMRGTKNSLNVANALTLAAGEIIRQKTKICEEQHVQ